MRSAFWCILLSIIVQRGSAGNDFRPTPIPLSEWGYEPRQGRVGTLHEAFRTEAPPTVAAVPAHYWEDALRHSVYLTLVRDKIDQLISQSDATYPDTDVSKEVDDRDLWEKIKKAPFDRINGDEHGALGDDVTTMAKGKLIEDKGGYRFLENDGASDDYCSAGNKSCADRVKAVWSVKRVKQKDTDAALGKHHYELTFSVVSQPPKKERKPYETPVRTFTVRENDSQHKHLSEFDPLQEIKQLHSAARAHNSVWFHKNISPKQSQGRQYQSGLERIFSSLFDDDDERPVQRYKPTVYLPSYFPSYSKLGYAASSSEQQQKKLVPYPYKPHTTFKYRPQVTLPPHLPSYYLDMDSIGVVNNQFPFQSPDTKFSFNSEKPLKPTTAPLSVPPTQEASSEIITNKTLDISDAIFKPTESVPVFKSYNKVKSPLKVNYFPDNVRPPVFNAPPGVFVTLDKKPFKPMPPLKLVHSSKPYKTYMPTDFRPSPQLLDVRDYSEPDTFVDTAFRPITANYDHKSTTEKIDTLETTVVDKVVNEKHQRRNTTKKPAKKHENIKSQRFTTTTNTPDIITVQNTFAEAIDMQWTNLLTSFAKTTPMASEKEETKSEPITTTTTTTTSITPSTTTSTTASPKRRKYTTTTENIEETTTTTTTQAPTKRTRPPPKFKKPEKVKKHKRTSTTTKAPERPKSKRPLKDLTPQASSSVTKAWEHNQTIAIPTTSTTTSTTTTTTTTTTPHPTTITAEVSSTQPKNKNRFRQSTLMQKGTSVNHDKWSIQAIIAEKNKTVIPATGIPPRRKGSNFQGYLFTTPINTDREPEGVDHVASPYKFKISSTSEAAVAVTDSPTESSVVYDEVDENEALPDYAQMSPAELEEEDTDEMKEQESKDNMEYIYPPAAALTPSESINEVENSEESYTTEAETTTTTTQAPKKKQKCKKKKPTTTSGPIEDSEELEIEATTPMSTTTTPATTTADFFQELFSLTFDKPKDSKHKPNDLSKQSSDNHERFIDMDDDFEDLLEKLENKDHGNEKEVKSEEYSEEEEEEEEEEDHSDHSSPFENDDIKELAKSSESDIFEPSRPLNFFELMSMD